MKFDFKTQTKTVQNTITAVSALIVIGLVWWAITETTNNSYDNRVMTATSTATTSVNSIVVQNKTFPKNTVGIGGYANGTYVGYIKNISKADIFTFTIDFAEYLTGKEAFLAAASIAAVNPKYNWDIMKDRFPTYAQLAAGIRKLTNTEFEGLYSSYIAKAGDNKSGILTAFPNGFVFTKNAATTVRVIPGDKKLGSVTVSNSSIQITMDDLYLICRNPTPEILDMYYRKYNAGVTCENPMRFTISKGVVTGVQVIYQP